MNESLLSLRLRSAIDECATHCMRINEALSKIQHKIPFTIKTYEAFTSDDVMVLDQFIYRYTKLQDKIGSSLIKNICIVLEGDDEQRTFIDSLNILEKHGILEKTSHWDEVREMRNMLSHEYFNDSQQQVDMFNDLLRYKDILFQIFKRMKKLA